MREERFNIREEAKLIPAWAIILAVLAIAGMEALFLGVAFRGDHHAPPLILQPIIGFLPGSVLALAILLGGYVNRDAQRRGMNRALWTTLVFLVPNGIGFILYFLLRHPLKTRCPNCGTEVAASFNFCPNCKYNLLPTCSQCKHGISAADRFCPHCGYDLAAERQSGGPPATPVSPAPAS